MHVACRVSSKYNFYKIKLDADLEIHYSLAFHQLFLVLRVLVVAGLSGIHHSARGQFLSLRPCT